MTCGAQKLFPSYKRVSRPPIILLSLRVCEAEQDIGPPVLASDAHPHTTGYKQQFIRSSSPDYDQRRILNLQFKTNKDQCSRMEITHSQWDTRYMCAHQPDHTFSAHANATFRFIYRREFSPTETKGVHVNSQSLKIVKLLMLKFQLGTKPATKCISPRVRSSQSKKGPL